MGENGKTLSVAVSFLLGVGLMLGLLYVLTVQPSPVSAAARRVGVRGVAASKAASGDVITVCLSGACDFDRVQDAVDAAQDGDEIRVAAGTYTGVSARAGVTQVVYISKSVTLRGGYSVTNWHTSHPVSNPTTLDAEGRGRVLYLNGGLSITVEGLGIIGGSARGLDGGPSGEDVGGGLYVDVHTITISDCQVMSNTAHWGGGVYVVDGVATLLGNDVVSNIAQRDDGITPRGGGVYLQGSEAVLRRNIFRADSAEWGGGLYARQGDVSLMSNRWIDNRADDGGGGVCASYTSLAFSGDALEGNRAELGGGAYFWQSDATVVTSTFSKNVADWGGGFYQAEGTLAFRANDVIGNTANRGAGGAVLEAGFAAVLDSSFIANKALGSMGGGLYLWSNAHAFLTNTVVADNRAAGSGSGLYLWSSVARLVHTTWARNLALEPAVSASTLPLGGDGADSAEAQAASQDPAGVWVRGGEAVLTDTIIVGHKVGFDVTDGGVLALESTLWGSGAWANDIDWSGSGSITHTQDHWGDPAFVDPDASDYHITSSSAALDQGVDAGVSRDADGDPRPLPVGGGFDLGADEYAEIDLSASRKTAYPDQGAAGDVLTYTIRLLNEGNVRSRDTVLIDPVPTGTTYLSGSAVASAGVVTDGNPIHWSGTLTPHQPVTVTFSITLDEAAPVRNTAVITDERGGVTRLLALVNDWRFYLWLMAR